MDSQEYFAAVRLAAERFEAGDTGEARAVFERIVADDAVPELDRNMMGINLATVLTKAGAAETEIEAAYDRAIELEQRWMRGFATESKAVWLASAGRAWEARELLAWLRGQPWLTFGDRDRIDGSLDALG